MVDSHAPSGVADKLVCLEVILRRINIKTGQVGVQDVNYHGVPSAVARSGKPNSTVASDLENTL